MSLGGGTLACPGSIPKGTAKASSSNGKQHILPTNPAHGLVESHEFTSSQVLDKTHRYDREGFRRTVQAHWELKQPKGPTRLWGTTKPTRWLGEERVDGEPQMWTKGEFWNCDSNIKIWGAHEVRRNAAAANHDVHRHDQKTRALWQAHPKDDKSDDKGDKLEKETRQCTSGTHCADAGFLEAWGFDLGQRDRSGNPTPFWGPVGSSKSFTTKEDFTEIGYGNRKLRKQVSAPVLRDSAKLNCGMHTPAFRRHPDGYACKDNLELSPASVYNRKYKKFGEEAARKHVTATEAAAQGAWKAPTRRDGRPYEARTRTALSPRHLNP